MKFGWLVVAAGALQREDGRWLMHKRPPDKHYAGLWEFPGGKVEVHEMPVDSLVRELQEELGIGCDPVACSPIAFAEGGVAGGAGAIVILLYTVSHWNGVPAALEGGEIGWFTPAEVRMLSKPPLDGELARVLLQNR